ncbi:MAG: hypothetical protein Aurels2KO_14510 [Aureliella sp.]
MVRLRDGTRLWGFIIERDTTGGLTLAVERKWLESTYPQLGERAIEQERQQSAASLKALVDRIQVWRRERKTDETLIAALDLQLEDLQRSQTTTAKPTKFALLKLKEQQIASTMPASAHNRQIAGVAFQQGLDEVTTSSTVLLKRKLSQQGIDVTQTRVDLSAELPTLAEESDKDWKIRQALFEYHHREPLQYQGTGTKFYKSGEDQDVMQVATDLMGSGSSIAQLGAELGLPEFQQFAKPDDTRWWNDTCKQAEADGFCGVLIKRLQTQPLTGAATVSAHFFAKLSAGNWTEAFRATATKNTSEVKQNQLDRLKDDPQVKKITQMASGLGFALGDKLDTALRMGAATQLAMDEASATFQHYLVRYIDHLDRPRVETAKK